MHCRASIRLRKISYKKTAPMSPVGGMLLLLSCILLLVTTTEAGFDFDLTQDQTDRQRKSLSNGFDFFSEHGPEIPPISFSQSRSSKSDTRESRSEQTVNDVQTHLQRSSWTRGFMDDGKGGLQKLDSSSSEERTAGRSAKELKASESGSSIQRDQRLTQENGKTVLDTETGKQSSFNNGGHTANRTEFSSESSSSDNRLAKVLLPPPPPPLAACFSRTRANLVFLVHTGPDAQTFARVLDFLETFLDRLAPARTVVVFFNRRVLDVLEYPFETAHEGGCVGGCDNGEALRHRLSVAARSLRGTLDDDCNLSVAASEAERLRRKLRIPSPCSLVLVAPGSVRADERNVAEARVACDEARRSFDQMMTVVGRGDARREIEPQAAQLLDLFSGGPRGLVPLDLGGGDIADTHSADALGQRVCDAAEFDDRHSEERGDEQRGGPR